MNSNFIPIGIDPPERDRKRQFPKGRQVTPIALEEIKRLIGAASLRCDMLIEHLHSIQDHYGHLSADHLAALAKLMCMPQTSVFEVASFYHHFDIVKEGDPVPPKLTIRVCTSLSCDMAGSDALLEKLAAILEQRIRVVPGPCMGRCEQAPVAMIGQYPVPRASVEKVGQALVQNLTTPIIENYIDYGTYLTQGGYVFLRECHSGRYDVETVIETMEASGLRGLGGAGFPAGRKWRAVRDQRGPRLMAVNIDEGEPGTFKDRNYLEKEPHRFLEGMLIAAWAVQIHIIYIYLRDEYHGCRALLENEIKRLQDNPPVSNMPVIHLRRGAGAYICGEESAMIESIEGKRGMPRLRPPYVAQVGLFGRPTLEHNFETLYWVTDILEKGADWFAAQGKNGRSGLRSYSVSGRVKIPGVKLAPAGITVQELIDEYCGGMLDGHKFYAYLPGGASGGILPATMNDIPLDFDTLQAYGCFIGSAAIIILSEQDTASHAAQNILKFFKDESCGQCTPCRVGTAKAYDLINQPKWDLALLKDLSRVMRDSSICGLGQAAPNPIDCVIKYFPQELANEEKES